MIYLLLIGLIVELAYCYHVFGKDLFSPSAVLCEVFILSTLACMFNIEKWGVSLGADTTAVILGGNAIFIFVSTMVHRVFGKKKNDAKMQEGEKLTYINIRWSILALVAIVYLVFSVMYARTVMSILSDIGQNGDFVQGMAMYRSETVSGDISLPSWLIRMNLVLGLGIYVLIYVFVNNFIVDRKRKRNYLLLIAIAVYLASSIFTAQRTTILLAFIYAMFVIYTLLNRKYKFIRKINSKYVFKGTIILVVFFALFGAARGLFGRMGNTSPLDNVTYYMGNSIESLDLFIRNPLEPKQFGEETFRQFRLYLSDYGLVEKSTMKNSNLEFRQDENGNRAGNVYTGYRYYIHDFGYGSIIFIQIFQALFFGIWYEKLNCRKLKSGIDLSFVLFAWFMLTLFRFSITESFFNWLAAFVFTYWYIFLLWKIVLSINKSFKRSSNKITNTSEKMIKHM